MLTYCRWCARVNGIWDWLRTIKSPNQERFEEVENKWRIFPSYTVLQMSLQEALRAKALKEQEKERKEFYDKQKMGMKDNRAKYREKVANNHL